MFGGIFGVYLDSYSAFRKMVNCRLTIAAWGTERL